MNNASGKKSQANTNLIPLEKPTENWTKFPNNILDNINFVTPTEFKILAVMVRKNLGFQDTNFEFSLTFLCRKTGMTHKTATKAVDGLLKKNSIKELTNGDRRVRRFQVVWKTPEEEKVFDDPLEIPIPEDVLPPHLQTESIKDVLRKHVREHVQKQASDWVEQYVLYALKNCSGKQDEDTFRAYLDQSMIDEWRIGKQKPPAPSPTDPKKICDHEFAETANGGKMCRKCDRIIDKDGNIVN